MKDKNDDYKSLMITLTILVVSILGAAIYGWVGYSKQTEQYNPPPLQWTMQ